LPRTNSAFAVVVEGIHLSLSRRPPALHPHWRWTGSGSLVLAHGGGRWLLGDYGWLPV